MHAGRIAAGRIAAVSLTGVAAIALAAPAASASASPKPVYPGQILLLSDDSRCRDVPEGARASSPLFGDVALGSGSTTRMTAAVRIPVNAEPGTYPVSIRCGGDGRTVSDTVTVPGDRAALPVMGAKAGLGGSFLGGSDTTRIADGALLLALAGGGALLVLRRRANGKG